MTAGGTPQVAVLGAGAWGSNLARTLHDLSALGAVVDPAPSVRRAVAARYPGVAVHAALADVLGPGVAAVAIATPAATHHAIAKQALLAGKDVFVEKPMTLRPDDAEELTRLAEREGRVLMVGHLLLYQPAIEYIARQLRDGLLGRLHSLHQERLKLGRVRAEENVLWSFGVHDIAVLLHLVGSEPTDVCTASHRILQPEVEDDVHLHLGFEGGVQAHLHVSWLWPETRRRLTVIGSEGMLTYDEVSGVVTLHRKTVDADLAEHDGGTEVVFTSKDEPLRLEMEHFLARVRDRGRPLSDGWDGTRVVRVLERAAGAG